ncbi:MAG TPA: hypothetical protein VE981_15490 [Planctomycetota bacterium]|nr:hypothetical protein [Planctomycetota bacterium]
MDAALSSVQVGLGPLRRSRGGSLRGPIWFEFDGVAFPEARWDDSSVAILGGWVSALRSNDRYPHLRFKGGAFELQIDRGSSPGVMVAAVERTKRTEIVRIAGSVKFDVLRREILRAARTVLRDCGKQKWTSKDVDQLAKSLEGA